jgi:hypothetical protein
MAWFVTLLGLACGSSPRLALEPMPARDDDRYDVPQPTERIRDDYYDLVDYSFFEQFGQAADMPRNVRKVAGKPKEAMNVTPLDEVLDSTWFTNRIGRRRLSPAELRQGANRREGPDMEHDWTIVAGKSQGVTPGFTIEDAKGVRYVIKPDPMLFPQLATGADMIATRLFWALGFNVTEDYLVRVRPEQLKIGPKATVKIELGKRRPLTKNDLDIILSKAAHEPDGSVRVIASRFLSGKPLGPIPFLGVREDDPNDVIRHEHRRELRGYKVFSAWLNHNDSREINSLDMYVEEHGRKFVKHYLIDLNATLGSASIFPNLRSEGYEYIFDLGEMGKEIATLGTYSKSWEAIEYPGLRGIGNFEAQHFEPESWKPNYPCPPFENTTTRDAFWAAKLVMRFDDELLRAAVAAAEYSDSASTEYMVATLAERRDRIGRYWFSRVNPLDEFEIVQAPVAVGARVASKAGAGDAAAPRALRFEDLSVKHGFAPPRRYDVDVHGPGGRVARFVTDSNTIELEDAVAALGVPAATDTEARLVRLSIRSGLPDGESWTPRVHVTVYLEPSGALRVAAIERDD